MNIEQEYIEFWTSIANKRNEIQKDYFNLSDVNKRRVDNVLATIIRAHNIAEVINILDDQMKNN